jgi:hypothetical protein
MDTTSNTGLSAEQQGAAIRKIYWRLIPLRFLMMFFNYLDRINLGFAGLQMNHDLGFTPAVFGFGASIFFLGYTNSFSIALMVVSGFLFVAAIIAATMRVKPKAHAPENQAAKRQGA